MQKPLTNTPVGYIMYVDSIIGADQMEKCPHCEKKKDRPPDENKKLINRLNRISGQINGIKKMVEESAYCPDILLQVAAAYAALNSFG